MQIQQQIDAVLNTELAPLHLSIENDSHRHSVPPNSETHFNLLVVSRAFDGKRQVARHQLIYKILSPWMQNPIHALALQTLTPEEWSGESLRPSPDCLGGSKADHT